ncbi:baseplate hub protein [Commensalibacter oyaizuii]|uniref:Uncharacterized protein n=1 Tax=Commensalibacter oyaizuii TaxID=3043873 RepID=A0ABT6Q3J7_9PROT|nr:hypothetical protein [Commensalibacter sp. TBRC 16381]MDI2091693.1 hypothetical protein [Commensalibacter sp. TBRC 16381]
MDQVTSDLSQNFIENRSRVINSFRKRYLKFVFINGVDQYGNQKVFDDGKTVLEVEGLKATASIRYDSGNSLPECECTIYNMAESLMNTLTTMGQYGNKTSTFGGYLIIYASIYGDGTTDNWTYGKVFEGGITVAYTDYGSSPDIIFHVRAMVLGGLNLIPADSISFSGKVSVDHIFQKIIDTYNRKLAKGLDKHLFLKFKNYGVKAAFNNINLHGDFVQQIRQCAADGNFRFNIQDGTVYIWPMDQSINEAEQKAVTASQKQIKKMFSSRYLASNTGMVGYPAYADNGITVRSIFSNTLSFGEEVEVNSVYEPACGIWRYMISMQHELSCFVPNGSWFTTIGLAKEYKKNKESNGV